MMKKLIIGFIASVAALSVIAGTINLQWTAYTSDPSANAVKIYLVPGTNTVFTVGNANATLTNVVSIASTNASISGLIAGQYTLTATVTTTNGLESADCPTVTGFVPLGGVLNFQIKSITTP